MNELVTFMDWGDDLKFYRLAIGENDFYLDIDELYDFLNAYPQDISEAKISTISEEEYNSAVELEDISGEYETDFNEDYFDEDGDLDIEMD